ncbi:hypothetical protein KP509_38G002300 [Ceratopteris richardii]|uniref:Uncharacterized protein n=1 Tax=Ceratopteris richardii TaxID=49495 RepID=A0A8T2Q1Z1_CERRI|nr:hypothetical protein KP509_38G002300 [Ceratopteris richardii]
MRLGNSRNRMHDELRRKDADLIKKGGHTQARREDEIFSRDHCSHPKIACADLYLEGIICSLKEVGDMIFFWMPIVEKRKALVNLRILLEDRRSSEEQRMQC